MNNTPHRPNPVLVWWILWAAIIIGLLMMFAVLPGAPKPSGRSPLWFFPIAPFAFSAVVRWLVLPRVKTRRQALPLFVIGMAMAEGCALVGNFMAPELRNAYFILAFIGAAQFVPIFATRYQE